MLTLMLFIAMPLALVLLFPAEVRSRIRQLKRALRDDVRRRCTPEQWEAIKHEFADVYP